MKNFFIIISFLFSTVGFSQDAGALLNLHDFTDKASIDAIIAPDEGSLVYNLDDKKIYYYAGITNGWTRLAIYPTILDKGATNHTLIASDDGNVITFNGDGNYTLTIPAGLSTSFNISVYQKDDGTIGNGNVTIVAGAGVTIINRLDRFITAGDGAGLGIIALEANVYYITGDLKK